MVARILAVLAVLGLVAVADAACTIVRKRVVVQEQVVAQAVLVPAYGGSFGSPYGGPGQPAQQNIDFDLLRRLVEAVERLEARLDVPAGGYTAESVLRTDCAACHTDGKNPKGGFVLFQADGSLADLSLGDQRLIKKLVTTTDAKMRMPPERPLGAAKQNVILQHFSGQKGGS